MTLENLVAKGLSPDMAQIALDMHNAAINGNYVPKATFDAEREKLKAANGIISERDKQIAELGKFKGDNEALTQKVAELTQLNEQNAQRYREELEKKDRDMAVRSYISDKVYNADDILSKLDYDKITIKDGKVVAGIDDQLDSIKKNFSHYFKEASNTNKGIPPGWNMFNKTPFETSNSDHPNSEIEFGKQLAKEAQTNMDSQKRAAEIYFK